MFINYRSIYPIEPVYRVGSIQSYFCCYFSGFRFKRFYTFQQFQASFSYIYIYAKSLSKPLAAVCIEIKISTKFFVKFLVDMLNNIFNYDLYDSVYWNSAVISLM